MSASKLEIINQIEQTIHNLKMRWTIGIKRIDDEADAKLERFMRYHEERTAELNKDKVLEWSETANNNPIRIGQK